MKGIALSISILGKSNKYLYEMGTSFGEKTCILEQQDQMDFFKK